MEEGVVKVGWEGRGDGGEGEVAVEGGGFGVPRGGGEECEEGREGEEGDDGDEAEAVVGSERGQRGCYPARALLLVQRGLQQDQLRVAHPFHPLPFSLSQ